MLKLRFEPEAADLERVAELLGATQFFSSDEIAVGVELVAERLEKGQASGYEFLLAEQERQLVGYTCFGPIPCTRGSYDLYWIAVHPEWQGRGIGAQLLAQSEQRIVPLGGRRIYIETSARPQYSPTRAFYERCGYRQEALLADFYAPGDDKVIYGKAL
jgi:ribosomal protein S18 acetylase RimI-like enzyme